MNVALCRIHLRLHGVHSLKEKRQIGRSILKRVSDKFNVSISEVEDNDLWQRLTIGIACVSSDGRYANEVVSKVVSYVGERRYEIEVLDYEFEMIRGF